MGRFRKGRKSKDREESGIEENRKGGQEDTRRKRKRREGKEKIELSHGQYSKYDNCFYLREKIEQSKTTRGLVIHKSC